MVSLDAQLVLTAQYFMLSTAWSRALTVFLARWAIFLNLGIALALFVVSRKTARRGISDAVWSVVVATVLVSIIAFVVQRHRPFIDVPGVLSLVPPPVSTAFPSGHTSVAVALAASFITVNPLLGAASFLLALLVGFGRVAAGVHYPSDILGGIVVGLISREIVRCFRQQLHRRYLTRAGQKGSGHE